MRACLPLTGLVLLTACSPKIPTPEEPSRPQTPPATAASDDTPETVDIASLDPDATTWTTDFDPLDLDDGLAGKPMRVSAEGAWETRTTAAPPSPPIEAAAACTPAPAVGHTEALELHSLATAFAAEGTTAAVGALGTRPSEHSALGRRSIRHSTSEQSALGEASKLANIAGLEANKH